MNQAMDGYPTRPLPEFCGMPLSPRVSFSEITGTPLLRALPSSAVRPKAKIVGDASSLEALPQRPLADIVRTCVRARAPGFAEKGVRLVVDIIDDGCVVLADPTEVWYVLSAFLARALDGMSRYGTVAVRVLRPGGEHARLEIVDNGRGLSTEELETLFEDDIRSRLPAARVVVAERGGEVGAESAGLGHGSRVWFSLPVCTPVLPV